MIMMKSFLGVTVLGFMINGFSGSGFCSASSGDEENLEKIF
jgi:hypothetical protein